MQFVYTKIHTALKFGDTTILSNDCLHMVVERMAANDAVGYADYQQGDDKITLRFCFKEENLPRKSRLTGSPIEKFVTAQHMRELGFNAAICKLLCLEDDIPDEIALEILIDTDLAKFAYSKLLTEICCGVQSYNGFVDQFAEWLVNESYAAVWNGKPAVSIGCTLDLRAVKTMAPDWFEPSLRKVRAEYVSSPMLVF